MPVKMCKNESKTNAGNTSEIITKETHFKKGLWRMYKNRVLINDSKVDL